MKLAKNECVVVKMNEGPDACDPILEELTPRENMSACSVQRCPRRSSGAYTRKFGLSDLCLALYGRLQNARIYSRQEPGEACTR